MIDRRPNLGVDLDNVICDLEAPFRDEVFRRYNIRIPYNISKYNIDECCDLTREQVEVIFREGREMYKNLPIINGAKLALIHLKGYYRIHIITHRDFYKGIQADTRSWLDKNKIPYHKVTFTNSDKVQQVLNTDCKYMIEDCGETAIKLARAKQKVILFDYLYNRNFRHKLITRVKDWSNIIRILI